MKLCILFINNSAFLYSRQCAIYMQGGGLLIEEIFPEGNAYFDGRLIEGEPSVQKWFCQSLPSIYNPVSIFIFNTGDIILQIDRQELSHMSLAQATLALSTSSPLLTLTVYRPAMEDGMSRITIFSSTQNFCGSSRKKSV